MTLRVGFAGTPAFAARALAAVAEAGFTIPLVLTRPDKPKGRGLQVEASAVAREASRRGLQMHQPASLRSSEATAKALAQPIDVLVVAAYGLILPRRVLDWPRHGCLNIHASRLPRWRGAAPIQRAVEAGDAQSGVTIMQMDEGLDTGPVIALEPVAISPRETAGSLENKLADVGAALIVDVLARLDRDGGLTSTPQPADGASYAAKIGRDDARIDWTRDAAAIDRQVRALDPQPGAFTTFAGATVKIWQAEPATQVLGGPPGSVITKSGDLVVACGGGSVRVLTLQPAGGKRMDARAFAAGRALLPGARFESTA